MSAGIDNYPVQKKILINEKPVFKYSEKAQGLMELAISLIVILVILAGIVDLSRTIIIKMSLQDAAEEGIIFGSVYPKSCNQIKYRVLANLTKVTDITLNKIIVTYDGVACPSSGDLKGKLMKISITSSFPVSMPFLGVAIGSARNVSVEAKGIVLDSP